MCGDMLPRASKGGLIAVMRPLGGSLPSSSVSSSSSSSSTADTSINEFRIFLRNNHSHSSSSSSSSSTTHATFDVSDRETLQALKSHSPLSLQIEKTGDLLAPTDSEPLHSFTLSAAGQDKLEFELPSKLDLGVSSVGVVGRLITVMSGGNRHERGHVIGRGVLGWN